MLNNALATVGFECPAFLVKIIIDTANIGELPESRVRKDMEPGNLLVEGRKDGRWIPIEECMND